MPDFTKIRGTHYRLNGDPARTARELGWGRRLGLNAARVLARRASPHPPSRQSGALPPVSPPCSKGPARIEGLRRKELKERKDFVPIVSFGKTYKDKKAW